jgi:hypothetical protein
MASILDYRLQVRTLEWIATSEHEHWDAHIGYLIDKVEGLSGGKFSTDSMSSGAMYAVTPESNIVAADSPAASVKTPPCLSICDGTRFQPADSNSPSKSLANASGSGSGKTAKAKFCPAKDFVSAINLSCCSGDRDRGSLNLARASAASEAAFSALAARSATTLSQLLLTIERERAY